MMQFDGTRNKFKVFSKECDQEGRESRSSFLQDCLGWLGGGGGGGGVGGVGIWGRIGMPGFCVWDSLTVKVVVERGAC